MSIASLTICPTYVGMELDDVQVTVLKAAEFKSVEKKAATKKAGDPHVEPNHP